MENKYKNYDTTLFVVLLLFISGFVDAYSRAVFSETTSYHTGTLTKLGMNLADSNFFAALDGTITILIFICGVITCECTKRSKLDFMKVNVSICILCTILTIAFSNINSKIAVYLLNFFSGVFMNTFGSWNGTNTSVTVMTANLKKYGSSLYRKFIAKDSKERVLPFTCIIASYPFGAFWGRKLINLLVPHSNFAILFVSVLLLVVIIILNLKQIKNFR